MFYFIILCHLDTVMAVGSRHKHATSEGEHSKAELYSHSTLSWETQSSYPFHDGIRAFEIVARSGHYILFGGIYPYQRADLSTGFYSTDVIAKFNPSSNQWRKMGNLQNYRHGFGLIEIDKKFLVMGGQGNTPTEVCEVKNELIECTPREPTMNDFYYNPEMMMVTSNYANSC